MTNFKQNAVNCSVILTGYYSWCYKSETSYVVSGFLLEVNLAKHPLNALKMLHNKLLQLVWAQRKLETQPKYKPKARD